MSSIEKYMRAMTSQIIKPSVKIPALLMPRNKITDDNQSLKNGVINEESDANLRSPSQTGARRRRSTKS